MNYKDIIKNIKNIPELYEKMEVFRKKKEEIAVVIVPEDHCVKWFDIDNSAEFIQNRSVTVLIPTEVLEEIKEQLTPVKNESHFNTHHNPPQK